MRLGVRPVGGEIDGNDIDTPTQVSFGFVNPFGQTYFYSVQPPIYPVNLFAQHLVPFNDNIQLMLKILRQHADMMFKVIRRYTDMMLEHSLDLFEIISIHKISPR
jgi:hypothetical protein